MSFEPREFLIWDVVTNRIPPLRAAIARIVNDLDQ